MVHRVMVRIKSPLRWQKNYIVDALKSINLPATKYVKYNETISRDDNIEVLISNTFTREDFVSLPRLRHIIIPTSGIDGVDLEEAHQRGIDIVQDKRISSEGVVDYVYDQLRKFSRGDIKKYLKGKTVGLLGFGNVGRGIYERLASNKCSWYVVRERKDRDKKTIKYFGLESIDEVIILSDVLINALPLNRDTKEVLFEKTDIIRKGALIVNVSRSGILNERKVLERVLSGQFSGAIFDVYSKDINPRDYFDSRIVLTPHTAGIYGNSLNKMVSFIKTSIESILTR